MNLQGQVVGVNAQIASGGAIANAGVGFSIPANTVRRVVPTLISVGTFQVLPGGPADQAGLEGSAILVNIDGIDVPTGGDVIIEADGETIDDYSELLTLIASHEPGTVMELTIFRNGEQQQVTVTLGPRPTN